MILNENDKKKNILTLQKLKRVHGGASLLIKKGEEPSIIEKSTKNLLEKERIAKYAAEQISDHDCIFLYDYSRFTSCQEYSIFV